MRFRMFLLTWLLIGSASAVRADQPQPPADFVPVENAPPGEQIPAMSLLGAATLIWVGVFGYVWSLSKRLQKVEAEIAELEARKR